MEEQIKDVQFYLKIIKARKVYFIIPSLVIFISVAVVAFWLPSIYQSKSTILIVEQQIPPEFVRSTVTGFADERIQSLTQQILSRSRLWEIIGKFNLYPELRQKYTREEIVTKMRRDISIETISAEVGDQSRKGARRGGAGGITIAFSISFLGERPDEVQKVAGNLASLYLEENLRIREAQARTTTEFLEAELKELKERIRTLGTKITSFKEQHEGMLPEQQPVTLGQVGRLEMEISQIDNAIRAAEDKKTILEGQLVSVNPDISGAPGDRAADPQTRLRTLELTLADLQSKFSADHPDIRKVRREMAELEKLVKRKGAGVFQRGQKLAQLQADLAAKQGKYSDQHPDIKKLKSEIEQLEKEPEKPAASSGTESVPGNPAYVGIKSQIQVASADIANFKAQRKNLEERLSFFRQRLEQAPKVEQEYLALQRDYQNASAKHQEVMNKILEARISEGMEEHQKGEKFILIDPANYPERPVKPNRLIILAAGLMFGLSSGLGAVALAEHLDHSVKSADELTWLTSLPVLGTIPIIPTKEDAIQEHRKRKLILAITVCCLILGLAIFHFFFMNLGEFPTRVWSMVHRIS
jgi:uncharacterized protein involved in exopolysaccharide biosynthesis